MPRGRQGEEGRGRGEEVKQKVGGKRWSQEKRKRRKEWTREAEAKGERSGEGREREREGSEKAEENRVMK